MKALDSLALGAAMVSQLSCAAPISGERRDMAPVEASSIAGARHGAEVDLDVPPLPNDVTAAAAKSAADVEQCLLDYGRFSLEVSPTEAYIVESIRPTAERPEVGIRIGQYFMCDDSNQRCGVAYAMPNQYSDNFGGNLEYWGLEAMRFHDVSPYTGKMTGADGKAERMFDFNLPPGGGGHEAICMPMPPSEWAYGAFADRRPASPGLIAHTDLFGCKPPKTPNLTRAHFQEIYRGILAKVAKACIDGNVGIPGDEYIERPKMQGHGLGTIDTGTGTGRR